MAMLLLAAEKSPDYGIQSSCLLLKSPRLLTLEVGGFSLSLRKFVLINGGFVPVARAFVLPLQTETGL